LQVVAWTGLWQVVGAPTLIPIFLGEFCFSGCLSVLPAMTADAFGAKNVGTIYGTMMTAFILGNFSTLLIPLLGIRSIIPIMAGIMLVGTLLAFVVRRFTMKLSLG
jgi:MFS transporter, OFA family, oxalate/formate antiporter